VKKIKNKIKLDVPCLLIFVVSIVAFVLFGIFSDEVLFERSSFIMIGYFLFFLHAAGYRSKSVTVLRFWLFNYDSGSDVKRKVGFAINLVGMVAGVVVMLYGIHYFASFC